MDTHKNQSEEISIKNILYSFRFWPQIFSLFWNTKKSYFVITVILYILQGLMPFLSLLITQELVNSIALSWEKGFEITVYFFILFILITLLREVVSLIQNYYQSLYQNLFVNQINIKIMEKSNELAFEDFENPAIQDQLKRAQNESGHRPFQTFIKVLTIMTNVVSLVSSVIFLFMWKWEVALVIMLLPIISFYSFIKLGKEEYLISWRRASKWRESWYLTHIMTHYTAFKEIKMYGVGPYVVNKYKKIITDFYDEDRRILKRRISLSFCFELINLVFITSMIFIVIKATYLKEILIGNLVGYIQAINLTYTSSQGISRGLISLCQDNLYISQLFAYLEVKSSDEKHIDDTSKNTNRESDPPRDKHIEIADIKEIEFQNVSFRYSKDHPYALRNISFSIKKGETVAIVGANGSGKSTLIKLLIQLYSGYEGKILINGICAKQIERESLRKRLGVLFQDFMKYELPVRENIGFGNYVEINNNSKIYKAADQAEIASLVAGLPEQLDTQLGSWFAESYQLSGGQWQRIAIARAYLNEADVYIFDEPSSALDPKTEDEIFSKFKDVIRNKIGIFISHRFSNTRDYNNILVLDQGRIIEQGKHDELIALKGKYHEFYNLQVSAYIQK